MLVLKFVFGYYFDFGLYWWEGWFDLFTLVRFDMMMLVLSLAVLLVIDYAG